jgi:hypothetical protein
VKKKKKVTWSKYFFGGYGKNSAIFFIAFLSSPCYETPKNTIKKNRPKQRREKRKKHGGEFFFLLVMS